MSAAAAPASTKSGSHVIDGSWVEPPGDERFDGVNPTTRETFYTAPLGVQSDVAGCVFALALLA